MRAAANNLKRVKLELGGKSPQVIFADAPSLDTAAASVAKGIVRLAGQSCQAGSRVLVQRHVKAEFVERLLAHVAATKMGDPLAEGTTCGPLVTEDQLRRVEALVEEAKTSARLLAGGKRINRKGYFFEPTVLADVPNSARIMNEEPFGPIAILNPFRDFDAVMAEANRLPYGLAAFGFTNNAQRVNLLGERFEAGMIGLNSFQISVPESPFGGVKESGHGSEEGIEGLEACLVTKFISQG